MTGKLSLVVMNVPDIKEFPYPQTTWKQASKTQSFPSVAPSLKWSHHPLGWWEGCDFRNNPFLQIFIQIGKMVTRCFLSALEADKGGEKSVQILIGKYLCVLARRHVEGACHSSFHIWQSYTDSRWKLKEIRLKTKSTAQPKAGVRLVSPRAGDKLRAMQLFLFVLNENDTYESKTKIQATYLHSSFLSILSEKMIFNLS